MNSVQILSDSEEYLTWESSYPNIYAWTVLRPLLKLEMVIFDDQTEKVESVALISSREYQVGLDLLLLIFLG